MATYTKRKIPNSQAILLDILLAAPLLDPQNCKRPPNVIIRSIHSRNLNLQDWPMPAGQLWCVLGNNASGKSLLAAAICGENIEGEAIIEDRPKRSAWIGFETLQAQYEAELANDDTDFLDRLDLGSTGLELLLESGCSEEIARSEAQRFGIANLLDRGCRVFSSGELRRVQLLAEWLRKPDLLILDEPFDALDAQSRSECSTLFAQLALEGQAILLLVNRIDDIAPWTTHIALLRSGTLLLHGTREEVLHSQTYRQLLQISQTPPKLPPPQTQAHPPDPILRFRNGFARHSEEFQFHQLDWTLRPGEHTLITGPNGCGKSTLLSLITGDHPQCYANDLLIFGHQRGSGESIWDIKRHIGIVSPAFHRDYRAGGSASTVVLSGYFDSIGLYQTPTAEQRHGATDWLTLFSMQDLADRPFRSLSYGQQRLALIARALVKQPPLLILDEPTQGLDEPNRNLLLACLQQLAGLERTTILFVSHREDEHIPLFKKRLHFEPSSESSVRFKINKLI